jgi:HEAT repeat protein
VIVITSALAEIGAPAVPALIKALTHEDPNRRAAAAGCLGMIGEDAKAAIPSLVNTAKNDTATRVRIDACWALVEIAPRAPETASRLILAASDKNPVVRFNAVLSLPDIDPTTPQIVEELQRALADQVAFVRRAAYCERRRWPHRPFLI